VSTVWKEWKIKRERDHCALVVTVESDDSHDGKYLWVVDPEYNSEGQGAWIGPSLAQAKQLVAALTEAIALVETPDARSGKPE
jgi:hypothetical protein